MGGLFQSFEENSFVWILISGGIGGIIGSLIKFLFEQVIGPRYVRATEAKVALRQYIYPILRSADALDRRLENFIRFVDRKWFDDPEDDYYRLSTLYLLGSYFGWCKILEDEAFLEYETSDKRAKEFSIHFYRVFKGITGYYYFQNVDEEEMPSIDEAVVPRFALTAIGELMIKDQDPSKTSPSKVLQFIEFTKQFEQSEEFRRWFRYLEELLSGLRRAKNVAKWNRLVVFAINLRIFVSFLDTAQRHTTPRQIYYLRYLHPKVAARVERELTKSGYSTLLQA
ncbi:MAG: hypothetical protein GTO14_15820 [Anaerolineales bacterium]|nr:hypothetical protein [Anaerolineales bacterium]